MHGKEDTNVPPVESEQMFTALKVLNKDVVYVRWEGEGHGISSKPSSSREGDLMMVEWFDKYLKSQPEAWEADMTSSVKGISCSHYHSDVSPLCSGSGKRRDQ